MRMNPQGYLMLLELTAALVALPMLISCSSGSGSGGTYEDRMAVEKCLKGLVGSTWRFNTKNATVKLTFDFDSRVSGISMSSCSGMKVDKAESLTFQEGTSLIIQYTAICAGKSYPYVLEFKWQGACDPLVGTSSGEYKDGHFEVITMTEVVK